MVLETCWSQVMCLFQGEKRRRNCFHQLSYLTWIQQVLISHHSLFLCPRSERKPHATCLRDRQTEEPLSSSPIMQLVWGWELNASCVSLWPKLTHCIPPKVNVWWRRDGEPDFGRAALLSVSGSAERRGSLTWPALHSGRRNESLNGLSRVIHCEKWVQGVLQSEWRWGRLRILGRGSSLMFGSEPPQSKSPLGGAQSDPNGTNFPNEIFSYYLACTPLCASSHVLHRQQAVIPGLLNVSMSSSRPLFLSS